MSKPVLIGVGLGPGDPELITLKGLRAIQEAALIFVPRSRDGSMSLAQRIAEPHIDHARQRVIDLPLPMTRNADELVPAWQGAAGVIAEQFAQSSAASAVYLLLGDPLLYGTFIYIWQELLERHSHIDVEIIPGITSFAAAAANAQLTLATTSERVAILPASYETDAAYLKQTLSDFDTVILMKAGPVLPQLLNALNELNLLDSAIYAERVGMPEERVVTDLRTMQVEPAPYLSLLIVRSG